MQSAILYTIVNHKKSASIIWMDIKELHVPDGDESTKDIETESVRFEESDGRDALPTYNSLRHTFLRDTPPNYEDITGNKL